MKFNYDKIRDMNIITFSMFLEEFKDNPCDFCKYGITGNCDENVSCHDGFYEWLRAEIKR